MISITTIATLFKALDIPEKSIEYELIDMKELLLITHHNKNIRIELIISFEIITNEYGINLKLNKKTIVDFQNNNESLFFNTFLKTIIVFFTTIKGIENG